MNKTIITLSFLLLAACGAADETSTVKIQEILLEADPQAAPTASDAGADSGASEAGKDVVELLKQMNDTLENCIGPAYGLNLKDQTCEQPPMVCW